MLGLILRHKEHLQHAIDFKPSLNLIQQLVIVAVHNNVYLLLHSVERLPV
jgi:hypothetical protein